MYAKGGLNFGGLGFVNPWGDTKPDPDTYILYPVLIRGDFNG